VFTHAFSAFLPSVLWHCWLGGRKSIRSVKKLSGEVLAWLSVWSEMQICIWPSWCHCHSLSLASVKSRLVLPFWYRLTLVVPEKGPLNGCVCVFTHEPQKHDENEVISAINTRRCCTISCDCQHRQYDQLSPRDRAMRCVSWNYANCHATGQKLLVRQVMNKSKLRSWRVKVGRCVSLINMCTQPWRIRVAFIVL